MAELADLQGLIGPSNVSMPSVNWGEVERALGLTLPSDYKQIASRYSSLEFDDFLLISNIGLMPLGELRGEKIGQLRGLRDGVAARSRRVVHSLGEPSRQNLPPHRFFPEIGGLLEWGSTTNGDHCLWKTEGEPDDWPVVITDDGTYWFEYPGGMLEFLIGWLTNSFDTQVLSSEFPDAPAIREMEIETGIFVPTPRWQSYFDNLE